MASSDKVKLRMSPNKELKRPLSTYDNLNTINSTESNLAEDHQMVNGQNVNEFPFGEISFRFDELQQNGQSNQSSPVILPNKHRILNSSDNNNDTNYKLLQNTFNRNNSQSENAIENGPSHQNQLQQGYTTAASTPQNHMHVMSNGGINAHHQYENVAGDTVNYTSIAGKPVHSDAKSTFFGLTQNINNNLDGNGTTMVNNNQIQLNRNNSSGDEPNQKTFDDNGNGESQENEPLINNYNNNNNNNSKISATSRMAQYQNIPNNSACFLAQSKYGDSDGCQCQFSDEINQCESDQFKCNCCQLNDAQQQQQQQQYPLTTANGTIYSTGNDMPSCSTSMKSAKPITLDTSTSFRMSQSLSQAVYMSTTVPQNIKGINIMGSHTPTRNSLRHSRMLVVNKNYQVPRRRNPLNIRHPTFAKILFFFHVLIGLGVSSLGLWLCWWAPSTKARENPYWSGLILMLSGILGLIITGFKRIPRHKLRHHLFTFLRINSSFVTFIAALCTVLASSFAILHLINLLSPTTSCRPVSMFSTVSACTCRFDNVSNATNSTINSQPDVKDHGEITGGSNYRDLSCTEVMGPFKFILIASAILNFIGFLLCCMLLILLCVRHQQVKRVAYSANNRNRL